MSILDLAIRQSGSALERVFIAIVLFTVSVFGIAWLSIAVFSGLSEVMSPGMAAAILGVAFLGLVAIVGLLDLMARSARKAASSDVSGKQEETEEVVSQAMRIAEGMTPGSPLFALLFALLAGVASVSLPVAVAPIVSKILDELETPQGGEAKS